MQVTLGRPEPLPGAFAGVEAGRNPPGLVRVADAGARPGTSAIPTMTRRRRARWSLRRRMSPARRPAELPRRPLPPAISLLPRAAEMCPRSFALAGQPIRGAQADLEPPAEEARRVRPEPTRKSFWPRHVAKLEGLDSYQVKMQRRERVGSIGAARGRDRALDQAQAESRAPGMDRAARARGAR